MEDGGQFGPIRDGLRPDFTERGRTSESTFTDNEGSGVSRVRAWKGK